MPGILIASVFRMKWLPQKSMHGLVHPFHAPQVMTLKALEQREVGLKLWRLVISIKPHQYDHYLYPQNADIDFHTPLVPLHQTFHP